MDEADFQNRLMPGEKILWTGRPAQGVILTGRDWILVPFSLLWGGFAVLWELTILRTPGAPGAMALFGAPFVLIGLYLIFGRFLVDAWVRGSISYALTDQRILIARQRPTASFTAIDLAQLAQPTLTERSHGAGTIDLFPASPFRDPWRRNGFIAWTPSLDPNPSLLAIADARRVFDQLQRAERSKAA
ncbi:MAG TPA: PH domain-containing protein [Roseiarcus sp.]|nr:PH domain-containing protein [Roseiarcus sp.]